MTQVKSKMKQLRALQEKADKNLQYLIDEACRILDNPLVLYDIDFKVLAYAENMNNGASFWDSFLDGGAIKQKVKDLYVAEGLSDIIVNAYKPVLISNEKLRYQWIFGKVSDKENMPVACVHVLSSDHSFVDDSIALVDALCKLLSNEILQIPYYQNYTQRRLEACITALLDRQIESEMEKFYNAGYVGLIYKGLKSNLYVAVADISQCDPSYGKLIHYKDLFKQTRPAFKYAIYFNHIIIIMSTDSKEFYPKRCFGHLGRLFEQDNIKVGISSRFENLFDLRKYYDEAMTALKEVQEVDHEQRIFVYSGQAESNTAAL